MVAVSRLMLDNFDHIKAYWISLGVGTAQTALAYGADDLDGTVRHERIHHDAGADSPEALTVDELRRSSPKPAGRSNAIRSIGRCGAGEASVSICSTRLMARPRAKRVRSCSPTTRSVASRTSRPSSTGSVDYTPAPTQPAG